MAYETERYTAQRVDRIEALEYEIKVLRMALVSHGEIVEENARLRGGYKGSCLTCESVGELNVRLEKENTELKTRLNEAESIIIKINYIGYGLNEFDLIEAYKKKWDREE